LEKLIFVNKSWPNDPRIGCKSPSSLVELINIDVDLEKEIEEFEFFFLKGIKLWSFTFWIKEKVTIYKVSSIFNHL
jgi:hypothetical protein